MPICRMFSKLKNSLFPSKMMHLSSLLTFELMSRNLLMRPGTDEQRQNMLNAYIKAVKTEYPNGGHIFVSSTHAHEVLHFLDVHEHDYTLHSLVNHREHPEFMPIIDKKSGVIRVFVEDDSHDQKDRHERFVEVQTHFRGECKPSAVRLSQDEMRSLRQFVLFYEIKLPFKKEFFIWMSQIRNRVSYCFLSSENDLERKVRELHGRIPVDMEERKYMLANTTQIYGSGPKHKSEIMLMADDGYTDEDVKPGKVAKPKRIRNFFNAAIGSYGLILQDGTAEEVILNE